MPHNQISEFITQQVAAPLNQALFQKRFTVKHGIQSFGLAVLMLPATVSAEVVTIGNVAKAFFPSQDIDTTLSTETIKHFSSIDEDKMLVYTTYVFINHGETPSIRWLEGFVKGQARSVQKGSTKILRSAQNGDVVTGQFYLTGALEGVGLERICQFKMAPADYGTWCITALGDYADKQAAVNQFREHASSFELIRD